MSSTEPESASTSTSDPVSKPDRPRMQVHVPAHDEDEFDPLAHLDMRSSTPLASQVAGHDGVMSDASGSLVIKPALPKETAFYQLVADTSRSFPLARLRPFLAQFYGTLRLEGRLEGQGELQRDIPERAGHLESLVLENVAQPFTSPSILDAKLGTVLHAPDAPPAKVARMSAKAASTTSHSTGLRLTGSRTWYAPKGEYIVTGRQYGYALTEERLGEGLARFFPLPGEEVRDLAKGGAPPTTTLGVPMSAVSTESDTTSTTPTTASSVVPAELASTELRTYNDHAISPALMVKILDILLDQLDALSSALAALEIRFIGSSLLVVYEGDPDRLVESVARWEARRVQDAARGLGRAHEWSEDDDDDEYEDEEDESEDEDEDEDDEDDDEEKERARLANKCPPIILRMIDFAHTYLAHGEGPDQGVLLGVKTLRGLVQARRDAAAGVAVA